jgi:hypothetical protein
MKLCRVIALCPLPATAPTTKLLNTYRIQQLWRICNLNVEYMFFREGPCARTYASKKFMKKRRARGQPSGKKKGREIPEQVKVRLRPDTVDACHGAINGEELQPDQYYHFLSKGPASAKAGRRQYTWYGKPC